MILKIKQYDRVQLKDGRIGTVVEVFGGGDVFAVDFGSSPKDWSSDFGIKREQIEKIV